MFHDNLNFVSQTQSSSITAIQMRNCEMMELSAYHGMHLFNAKTADICYHLLPSDNATLYRKFSRRNRVDVRQKPEYNIHDWLNPESSHFQPEIHRAIFHYAARSEAGERFEVCISTPEMEAAVWKYAHYSQLVLDGTFGVCNLDYSFLLPLLGTNSGRVFPSLSFFSQHPQAIRQHMQVTIRGSYTSCCRSGKFT